MNPYILLNRQISFQQRWEKLIDSIERLSPDALEEYDEILTRMDRLYRESSVRLFQRYLKVEDEYKPKLDELRSVLKRRVESKFHYLHSRVSGLLDYDVDLFLGKERFKDAVENYKLLVAFCQRWKHPDPELLHLRDLISQRHTEILERMEKDKHIHEYKQRLSALDRLNTEVERLYSWYCNSFLNLDGSNASWYTPENVCVDLPEDVSWLPVGFHDSDPRLAPLEHLRNLPSAEDVKEMERLFHKFIDVYSDSGLLSHPEVSSLKDYDEFIRLSDSVSLFSEDSKERLKAAVLEQAGTFHTLINDARSRLDFKREHERFLGLSFCSYFAPLDEVYDILKKGFISSEHSLIAKASGIDKGISLRLSPDIEYGDVGFIFPVTKMLGKSHFVQLNNGQPEVHLYNRSNPEKHVEIDVRDGVFIAPKDKMLKFSFDGVEYHETYEQYFRRFFKALALDPPGWFDPSRLEGWLSRHCIFYTDDQRRQLLKMLENKTFVSVINRFTNKQVDNLAFAQQPGALVATHHHKVYEFLDDNRKSRHAVTLFEWVPEAN